MKWLELMFGERRPLSGAKPGAVRPALAQALEPRMLFDGAVAATTADTLGATSTTDKPATDSSAAATEASPASSTEASHDTVSTAETPAGAGTATAGDSRQEVVFVDGQVQDYQKLVDALPTGTEVVVLDASRNGLEQIADYLQGRSGIDAIYLLSHGESGAFKAGDTWIDGDNLAAQGDTLARIGAALDTDGDILLYGCKTGEGEAGAVLVEEMARLTQADVAASDDNTGAAQLGGDWVLERHSGSIEAAGFATELGGYDALLAAPTTLTFDSVTVDGLGYSLGGSPRVFDGWTVALVDGTGANAPDSGATPSYLDVTANNLDTPLANGADKALVVNGYYNVVAAARFSATTGEQFSLQSFHIDNMGMGTSVQVVGYRDGVAVASQSITAPVGADLKVTLDSTADADWQNIDEFRIVQQDGSKDIWFAIDDITVATAVVPNVAPAIGNLNGDSVAYTEGGSAVLLDAGGNATVTDSDSLDFNGGNVTVAITGNRVAGEDLLSVRNQGSGAGQIGVSGSTISYGGTAIGTISGGSGSSDLVISLNSSATPAAVQALLRNLAYSNGNSSDPSTATRTLSITVNDGDGGTSSAANVTVSVTAVNDAPTLSATGGTPTYTENGSAVDLFGGVAISSVESGQTITRLTLTVDNLSNGSSEILRIDGSDVALTDGNTLTSATNGMTVTVSLVGAKATVTIAKAGGIGSAAAQTLVDDLSYRNASEAPGTASRVVTLTSLTDSGGTANGGVDTSVLSISAAVTVVATNDAPTLAGSAYALTGTNEDTSSAATLVSTLLAGLGASDADAGAQAGIAVTASSGNGSWQYSTDGVAWNALGAVSASSALLLSGSTQLRYVPDAQNGETATLTFRAWDQTTGTASTGGTRSTADTGSNGGGTAFSATSAAASLAVSAVNDAPVVSLPSSIAVSEDVSTALTGISFSDVDAGSGTLTATLAVASGTLSASGSGGVTVSGSGTATLTLGGTLSAINSFISASMVSFQTAANATADVTLTVGIDDGGNSGSGGALSASDTTTLQVTAVNDRPVVGDSSPEVIATGDSAAASIGPVSVSTLIGAGAITDVDGPLVGVAIVATSGAGTWQYSSDGSSWSDMGALSISQTLVLDGNAFVRYVPAAGTGESATLTLGGWDGSVGGNGQKLNAAATPNAFSAGAFTASITVSETNVAPLLTPASPALTGITENDTGNGGQTVASLLGGSVSDTSGALQGIAVTGLASGNGTWQYSLDGGASWSDVGSVSAGSALLLRASDLVRFVPNGITGTSASLTYQAWDQSGASAGQQGSKVDASVAGGSSAFSVASDTAHITVADVNDAPVATAATAAASEDGAVVTGAVVATDVDSTALSYWLDTPVAGLTFNSDGSYSFDPSDGAYQALAEGQTVDVVATYVVMDNREAASSSTLTITVTGSNDAPVASAASASLDLAALTSVSGSLLTASAASAPALAVNTYVDATLEAAEASQDRSDVYQVTLTAGTTYTIDLLGFDTGNGTLGDPNLALYNSLGQQVAYSDDWEGTLNSHIEFTPSSSGTYYLAAKDYGDATGVTYRISLSDGSAPLSAGSAAGEESGIVVTMAGTTLGDSSLTLTATSADVDAGAVVTVSQVAFGGVDTPVSDAVPAIVVGAYGTFTVQADGSYSYAIGSAGAALAQGESVLDTLVYTITDEHGATSSSTLAVTITGANDAPVASAASATLSEDDASVSGSVVASDVDHGATLTYTLDTSVPGLTFKPDGSYSFTLDTAAYQSLAAGGSSLIEASYTVSDGLGGSDTATLSIVVSGVNDAPVLTPSAPSLSGIGENDTGNGGQSVASILGASVTDVDSGALSGIALTGTSEGTGHWEYSLDGGASWSSVGTVSAGSALLLRASDLVRFVPDGANGTMASLSYRAWDQSGASAGLQGSKVDTGSGGGSSAFSAASDTASIAVADVNDAPTLATTAFDLAASDEDATSPALTVADLLASAGYADADSSASSGIAITGRTGNGSWQYSTDGSTWYALPSTTASSALLLGAGASLRYVGDGRNGETATLSFRAWDQTQGSATAGATTVVADTGSNGGITAFSAATATASLPVNPVNDAPTISATSVWLSGTNEDTPTVAVSISILLGAVNWADVDSGALSGIAITSATANGNWQYSSDGGTSWANFGSVSSTSALLLDSATLLRYQPDGINGETPSFTFKAWDQTSGTASSNAVRSTGDTTSGSAWSSVTIPFSTTVSAIADAPVVATSGGTTAFTEADGGGSTPVAVDPGLTLSDVDSATLASATVTISGNFQSGQDLLAFANDGSTMGNIAASYNAATGVLTLTSSGATATLAEWQAALRAVTYGNGAEAPNTATRSIDFVVNDGAVSSSAVSKSLSVASINDTPSLSVPTSIAVTEDSASALTGISFADADAGSASVTATLNVASGSLAATSASGVTVGGSGSATLTLSGSLADINAFIAAGGVAFTTAANATGDVTLTVGIDDGGNTGSGGARSASATSVLHVAAVNDAPTISAPASIAVSEDVTTALTGISFGDVDAGSAGVTVTLSVASGTLAATSGSGVSVGGSGSGNLTLAGSIADINAFIAASGVAFTTASNATGNVALAVSIDDGGNSGSDPGSSGTAGSEAASTTLTLSVTAVNDAPLNTVPASASVDQDAALVFSSGNGNAISISDVDAGSGSVRVTLTASHGLLSLAGTAGLTFLVGSGAADATMTFEGRLADINLALNGLTFTPAPGYNGPASLQIVSDDLGLSGSGGAQSDSDTVAITVNSVSPLVTGVSSTSPDGGYKVGDTLLVTVSFDQLVTVDSSGGTPTLLLETGSVDRSAAYVSGSGTNTLTFAYTVQAGDVSADLDYASTAALALNGASLRNVYGDDAVLSLPTVGGADSIAGQRAIVVDGIAPGVTAVGVPADGTYVAGQNLDFSVGFSEAVLVDTAGGTPRLAVTLDDGSTAYADYVAGSGSTTLTFRLTVANGQLDRDGIVLGSNLELNGGAIGDAVGNPAQTALYGVAATGGVRIDAVAPSVTGVAVPAGGGYNAGDVLTFTVQTSEAVQVDTSGGTPRLALDIGGTTRYAAYVSGSGTGALVFQYSVQPGDSGSGGIAVAGLQLNGGTVRDAAGNDLPATLNGIASSADVLVDTTAPTVSAIARLDASPTSAGSLSYQVSFDEAVSGVDVGDFAVVATGTASGVVHSVAQLDAHTYRVTLDGVRGEGTLGLELVAAGSGIRDQADNPLAAGLRGTATRCATPAATRSTAPIRHASW